jgi:hypothetical protein
MATASDMRMAGMSLRMVLRTLVLWSTRYAISHLALSISVHTESLLNSPLD